MDVSSTNVVLGYKTMRDMMKKSGKVVMSSEEVVGDVGVGIEEADQEQALRDEAMLELEDWNESMHAESISENLSSLISAEYTGDARAEYHTVYGEKDAGGVEETLMENSRVTEEVNADLVVRELEMVSENKEKQVMVVLTESAVETEEMPLSTLEGIVQQGDPAPGSKDAVAYECLKKACADQGLSCPSLKVFMQNSARGTITEKKKEKVIMEKKKEKVIEIKNKKRSKDCASSVGDGSNCRKEKIAGLKEKIMMLKKKKEGMGLGKGGS